MPTPPCSTFRYIACVARALFSHPPSRNSVRLFHWVQKIVTLDPVHTLCSVKGGNHRLDPLLGMFWAVDREGSTIKARAQAGVLVNDDRPPVFGCESKKNKVPAWFGGGRGPLNTPGAWVSTCFGTQC